MNNEKTNQSEHDLQVSKFFANLYKSKRGFVDHSYCDAASPGPKKRFISVERFIETKPWKDYNNKNNFFGVATRKSEENSKKANLLEASCFFVDLDCGTEGHKNKSLHLTKETGLEYIKKFPISPTVIIDSGNGYHLYWFLTQPYDLSTTDGIYEFESVNKCLSYFLMGDTTHDAGRILRIPGTLNHKTVPPKECQIIEANYDTKYDFDVLKNHQIIKIGKKIIKDKKIQQLLSRFDDEKYPTRSEQDWALVNALIKNGLDDDEIYTIFDSFPQSGKSHEKEGTAYLDTTIKKARYSASHCRQNREEYPIRSINGKNITYSCKTDPAEIGYYSTDSYGNEVRISNFIIKYDYFRKRYEEGDYETSIYCSISTKDQTYKDVKINSTSLSSQGKFIETLYSITGPNTHIFDKFHSFKNALSEHNPDTPEKYEVEFGYDAKLENYYTPDFIINENGFTEKESIIRSELTQEQDQLKFRISTEEEVNQIIKQIEEDLFAWADTGIVLAGLAYSVLPLIYPFFEGPVTSRPYLFFYGESSCGKTEFARMLQRFYKPSGHIIPVTSTDNSVSIYGSGHKDCVVVLDDLKLSNFSSENEQDKLSRLIQNYSDGTGKQRATRDMQMRKDFPIKGCLLLTGEDIIFNQVSTIARGIILEYRKKADNPELTEKVKKLSWDFNKLTPHLIKTILSNKQNLDKYYKMASQKVNDIFEELNEKSSSEIIPRMKNNLILLYTGYLVFTDTFELHPTCQTLFDEKLKDIMLSSLCIKEEVSPEFIFLNDFTQALENRQLYFHNLDDKCSQPNPCVGHYQKTPDGRVKIQICMKLAVNHLAREQTALKGKIKLIIAKLESKGIIYTPPSTRVNFGNGDNFRGSYWIGDFPLHVLFPARTDLKIYNPNEIIKQEVNINKNKDDNWLAEGRVPDVPDVPAKRLV